MLNFVAFQRAISWVPRTEKSRWGWNLCNFLKGVATSTTTNYPKYQFSPVNKWARGQTAIVKSQKNIHCVKLVFPSATFIKFWVFASGYHRTRSYNLVYTSLISVKWSSMWKNLNQRIWFFFGLWFFYYRNLSPTRDINHIGIKPLWRDGR